MDKLNRVKESYHKRHMLGVMMFILSTTPLILAAILKGSGVTVLLMVVVMVFIILLGVVIVAPISAEYNAYSYLLGENNYSPEQRIVNKRIQKYGAFYFPLVTAIYLGWSLWTMAWGITWIIWPVSGVAFASFVGLMEMLKKS